jgi:hypothetical protein
MPAVFDHGLSSDRVIALSNTELVDKLYTYVGIAADECDEAGDALFFLVGEILERFAPDEARAELVRTYTPATPALADPKDGDDLLDALEGLRRRQAARLLRDTLGTDDA